MKPWLPFFLLLLTLTARAQGAWPRNPKSNKIEYEGTMPWPADAQTEAQRHALVRRWYLTKVTDRKPDDVATDVANGNTSLTYAGLPAEAILYYLKVDYYRQERGFVVSFALQLTPVTAGLSYHLSNFEATYINTCVANTAELENYPDPRTTTDPILLLAVPRFQKRITTALAGW